MIHVAGQEDIRFTSQRREEVISTLKIAFISKTKGDMKLFSIDAKDLKEFAKSQKDVDKGKNRLPSEEYLIDDGLVESTEASEKQTWEMLEEYKSSEWGSMVASEFDIDLNDNPIEKGEGGRSSTIYSREGSIEC